jgi:hypothetical protein
MPSTPLDLGAGAAAGAALRVGAALAIGARVVDRLTVATERGATRTSTGLALALGLGLTTGLGLTMPVKPMAPNVGETSGACAADGAETATDRAVGVETTMVEGAAVAGRASEATMAPEMTITAEALPAGLAEREIAEENDEDAVLKALGERWRPHFWRDTLGLDTVGNLSRRLRGQLSDSDGRYTRPSRGQSTGVDHHREGFTPRRVLRHSTCGSPVPAKRMLRVSMW